MNIIFHLHFFKFSERNLTVTSKYLVLQLEKCINSYSLTTLYAITENFNLVKQQKGIVTYLEL